MKSADVLATSPKMRRGPGLLQMLPTDPCEAGSRMRRLPRPCSVVIGANLLWRAGPPQFLKKRSENAWANEKYFIIFLMFVFPSIPGIAPGVAPRILGSYCSSREMPSRDWNFAFRESNFEFRELLREFPGTLRELRERPFHSESVFPEIGVASRLLIFCFARHF